jgi:hypothetical protein
MNKKIIGILICMLLIITALQTLGSISNNITLNDPPNKPTKPYGPTIGETGENYRYGSYFSDQNGDLIQVFFDWGDGTDTGWIFPPVTNITMYREHVWDTEGTYLVKTKARDIPNLVESEWSDPLSVEISQTQTGGNAVWQEDEAQVGDILHADFKWWGAIYNPPSDDTAHMYIVRNSEMVESFHTTTTSGEHTLSFTADIPGVYYAKLLVYYGSGSNEFLDFTDIITVTECEPDYWAIIAAPPDFKNIIAFVAEAKYLKDALLSVGWKEDHIISLHWKNATRNNVFNAIDWVAQQDDPCDTTLVFFTDHGYINYFALYESSLTYSELNTHLDKLSSSAIGIMISACHSGSAIPYLQKEGRVIITSCRDNETGGYLDYIIPGIIGFADKKINIGDNNNFVSLEEAFKYLMDEWQLYTGSNIPQIKDDYAGELKISFLDTEYDRLDQFPLINSGIGSTNALPIGKKQNNTIYWQAAQSFKPSFNTLTKVLLYIVNYKDASYPLKVSIRKNLTGDDLTSVSIPSSELIEYRAENTPTSYYRYRFFDFPDIRVTPEETYYIVCSTSLDAQSIQYMLRGRKDDGYTKGESFQSEDYGESWFRFEELNYTWFATYGYNKVNEPPLIPEMTGPHDGIKGEKLNFSIITTDPEGDDVIFVVDWDDNSGEESFGPYPSGVEASVNHTWSEDGKYIIKVKARDVFGAESDWATFRVRMPKTYIYNPIIQLLMKMFQRFPFMNKILNQMIL